jgi:Mn2+/Fe2+ NRAMP family transporter
MKASQARPSTGGPLANESDVVSETPQPATDRRGFLWGPGLVFILGAIGPSDLISGSIAGAKYGYSLLWLVAVSMCARFVIVEATARYVVVSGESLLAGFGRISKWIVLLWFVVAVFQRHASALTKLLLLGAAAHMVFPLPSPHSIAIWGFCSWTAGFALMFWGRYRLIEKISKPLAIVLGSCLVAAAVMSQPDPMALIQGALTPVIPSEKGLHSPTLVLMVVLSAATTSFGNLKYSAYVHEKGWRSLAYLRTQRRELLLSMVAMFCMVSMIHIAAAGALKPQGIEVGKLEDLIPVFSQILGYGGGIVLGVTLWSIAFSSYLGNGTSYGIMFSDVYYRFARKPLEGAPPVETAGERPAFRFVVLFLFIAPLYALFTDWTPVGLVLMKSASNVVTLPLITLSVLRLTSDKKIMGAHANSWYSNLVLVLTTVGALYLSYQGVMELLGRS